MGYCLRREARKIVRDATAEEATLLVEVRVVGAAAAADGPWCAEGSFWGQRLTTVPLGRDRDWGCCCNGVGRGG